MSKSNPITPFLEQNGVLVIDGGLATELENRGFDLSDQLWSARLLLDNPKAIYQVHRDYLEAGADCIISASYQATFEGFKSRGIDEEGSERLLEKSVQIAQQARDDFWSNSPNRVGRVRPLVAASIGPYGAALADGSEYSGDYDLDEFELYHFHRGRWHVLDRTEADLLACETVPSYPETRALARLVRENPDVYVWISFSCRDSSSISDGTPISRCVRELDGLDNVAAVGINCTAPRFIPALIDKITQLTDIPVIVYPNSGELFDPERKEWSGQSDPHDFAQASEEWRARGAQLIGGCCRTNPGHIRQIRQRLLRQAG